ncbi:hypothetical protein FB451DRAFT_1378111 [Mycena latifolia]|nr:hypothetical protein FB451DRAFT_1378111 [Mycena latifolia]
MLPWDFVQPWRCWYGAIVPSMRSRDNRLQHCSDEVLMGTFIAKWEAWANSPGSCSAKCIQFNWQFLSQVSVPIPTMSRDWLVGRIHWLGLARLNLNGDLVADLRDRAVVACSSDGVEALQAMFTAVPLSAKTASVALKHMLQFNRAHTVYDADFRPPMYRRDSPSYSESTEAIPILVKRRGDEEMGEERPKKRAKRPNREPPATTVEADSGKGGRKLRPRKVR